jgi:hypothetical protein
VIEELKQLLSVITNLPELALHVIFGFGIYKLVIYLSTTGSAVFIGKLLINKAYDAYIYPKTRIENVEYEIAKRFICSDGTYGRFLELIKEMRSGVGVKSSYIHSQDVDYLIEALREKRERDKQAKEKEVV